MTRRTYRWWKGHGTENDFVLLPDPDGWLHADLGPEEVRALCHRRRGIGADGVLRVVRTAAEPAAREYARSAEWFMDFRNADGTPGEMCGNGVRVFARYLAAEGWVDRPEFDVATGAGCKRVVFEDDGTISVGMGQVAIDTLDHGLTFTLNGTLKGWSRPGVPVDMGNPHAVVVVEDLEELPESLDGTAWTARDNVFPAGVNVEFAVRRGPGHAAMRVLERGVGETRSCGTGACAVAAVLARADGLRLPATCRVDVPGGTLGVVLQADGTARLRGPAVLVARGETLPYCAPRR